MANKTMKAVRFHDYGGPEALVFEEVPVPQPEEGQVLIRLVASGVNPADWKMREGMYKQFMQIPMPAGTGLEGAGVVDTLGPKVTRFKAGQAVFGAFSGAYAGYAIASEDDIQLKPGNITFEEAATIPVGALTAWSAVVDVAQVQAGQRVLVHGAAGGVGLYVVQLARWKDAHVIGTASAANLEFVRTLGVEQVLDYNKASFETVLHDLDVVIDTVGGDLPERSLKVLRPGGTLVTVAGRLPADFGKAEGINGISAGRAATSNLSRIAQLVEANQLRPIVGKVFSLSEARQAQELSQTGHGRGRIVLKIAS